MDWQYEPADHYPTVDVLGSKGFPILVLPGMSNWDRIFPDMSKAMINIRNFTLDCYRQPHPLGSITSTWGDNGSKNLRELLYYGYAYGAEVSWSPDSTDVSSFSDRFFTLWNGPGTAPVLRGDLRPAGEVAVVVPDARLFSAPVPAAQGRAAAHDPGAFSRLRGRTDGAKAVRRAPAARSRFKTGGDCPPFAQSAERNGDCPPLGAGFEIAMVVRRKGDVDYLRYCADARALCRKPAAGRRSERLCHQGAFAARRSTQAQARFLERILAVRDEAASLRDTFKELWLRTNLPANLHYAIDDYNAIVKVWDDAAARVERGQFAYDPRPPARWIYHPDAFDGKPVPHAYFRKVLKLDPHANRLGRHPGAGRHARQDLHQRHADRRAVRPAESFGAGQSKAAGRVRHQAAPSAGRERDRDRGPRLRHAESRARTGRPQSQRRLPPLRRDPRQQRQRAADRLRRELEGRAAARRRVGTGPASTTAPGPRPRAIPSRPCGSRIPTFPRGSAVSATCGECFCHPGVRTNCAVAWRGA